MNDYIVVNMLAWHISDSFLLGAWGCGGGLGISLKFLHEISYFMMMELLFLLSYDFFKRFNFLCE